MPNQMKSTDETVADAVSCVEEELHSALLKLTQVLLYGKSPNEAAWWICANHPKFAMEQESREKELRRMASIAGTPPKGADWSQWFDRVRALGGGHDQ